MYLFDLKPSKVSLIEWNVVVIKQPYVTQKVELFVGYSLLEELGRLSTPIVEFDEKLRQGKTKSGSVYQLVGEPSLPHEFALYVLKEKIGDVLYDKLLNKEDDSLSFKYEITKNKRTD
jgi:hypothetical protein